MNIPGKGLFLIILLVLLFPAVYGQRASPQQERYTLMGCRPAPEPQKICGYFQPRSGKDLSIQPATPCDPYEMGPYLRRRAIRVPVLPFPDDFWDRDRLRSVSVTMLVDEKGSVISATAVGAPSSLRESAISAAFKTKFRPVIILGKRVKLSGVLTFNFSTPKRTTNSLSKKKLKVISGGVMNGKAVNLPKPEYPAAAMAVRVEGIVDVQILIDETGKVTAATAISGHPLLRASAVKAARQAEFMPVLPFMTEPYLISGIISYAFLGDLNWQAAGRVLGRVERGAGDRASVNLLARKLPGDFNEERPAIEALFSGSPGREERATKAIELIEAKLLNDTANAWRFSLGVSLERITGNINDDTTLGMELVKLRDLAANPPDGITGEITPGISKITVLAGQFSFTDEERKDILFVVK